MNKKEKKQLFDMFTKSMEVSKEEFDSFVQKIAKYVTFFTTEEKVIGYAPFLIVSAMDMTGEKCEVCMRISGDFNDHREKSIAMRALGRQLYSMQKIPRMVCFTSEAWLVVTQDKNYQGQPRHHPDRKEVITLFALTIKNKDGKIHQKMGWGEITRVNEVIQPVKIDVHEAQESEAYILSHFFKGYFQEVALKQGIEL